MTAQTTPVQLGQKTPASMKRAVIYARVSTSDQCCERQIADLTDFADSAGYDVLDTHKKTISDTKTNRHARNQVMALGQVRKIDAVLVTELSRWGRSYRWIGRDLGISKNTVLVIAKRSA